MREKIRMRLAKGIIIGGLIVFLGISIWAGYSAICEIRKEYIRHRTASTRQAYDEKETGDRRVERSYED